MCQDFRRLKLAKRPYLITDGKLHCDIRSVRKAKNYRILYTVFIKKILQVISKLTYYERHCASRRFSVTSRINGIKTVFFFKLFNPIDKIRAVFTVAVKENERLPLTAFFKI